MYEGAKKLTLSGSGPKLKPCPDERLEKHSIPTRIAELRLLPPTPSIRKRINALLTRHGEKPEEVKRLSPKKQTAWENANTLPRFVKNELPPEKDFRIIPSNVMAGLLVSAADEKRGYKLARQA